MAALEAETGAAAQGSGHYDIQTRNLQAEERARTAALAEARRQANRVLAQPRLCASCGERYTEANNIGRWLCVVHPRRRAYAAAVRPREYWSQGARAPQGQSRYVYPCCGADAETAMDERCTPCDHADRDELCGDRLRPRYTVVPGFLVDSGDLVVPPWAREGEVVERGQQCVVVRRVGEHGTGQMAVREV